MRTKHLRRAERDEHPGAGADATQYSTACLKTSAYEAIRDAILTGRYAPGMQLKEISLAEGLGLSRTPVRHALAKLAAEGLVAEVPRAGMFVRKLNRAEVVELLGLRRVIEAGAAALAAGRATPAEAAALREIAAQVDKEFRPRPRPDVEQLELAFHRRVVELSGNKEVERVFLNAQRFFFTLVFYPDENAGQRNGDRLPVTHTQVADAIASGDRTAAFQTMWDHVSTVESYL